jgi:ADP-ribose pyrophosphatase YjhB (NUDIX family)
MQNLSEQNYIQQISIDCVIFGYQENHLKVLVPKLDFKGDFYALPSGFVHQNEDIDSAAERILEERTGLKNVYLEQFKVFGKSARNSANFLDKLIEMNPEKLSKKSKNKSDYDWFTKRFISIGYYALLDIEKVIPKTSTLDSSINWLNAYELPDMIMDHNTIIKKAIEELRNDLDVKLSAFRLMPETFTMKDLQELYETIFEKPFVRANFQKKTLELNMLERLEKKFTGAANKAPFLYRLSEVNRK